MLVFVVFINALKLWVRRWRGSSVAVSYRFIRVTIRVIHKIDLQTCLTHPKITLQPHFDMDKFVCSLNFNSPLFAHVFPFSSNYGGDGPMINP